MADSKKSTMSQILIIDDDQSVRSAMSDVLSHHSYYVFTAENGKKAVDIIAQENIALVLLDIYMPEKDGIETIADIRKKYPHLPVIAMSGNTDPIYAPLLYIEALGANATLTKPFNADILLNCIRQHLN